MPDRIYSFAPIIDESSRILILGSLPSVQSLNKRQYYGHNMNQFWRILYAIFGDGAVAEAYEDRKRFILSNDLALWDIYESGEREGSMDKDIKNGIPNDVPGLLKQYPNIKRIVIGGNRAKAEFNRHFRELPVELVYVPSTSPITGRNVKPLEEKILLWKNALNF